MRLVDVIFIVGIGKYSPSNNLDGSSTFFTKRKIFDTIFFSNNNMFNAFFEFLEYYGAYFDFKNRF